MGRIFTFRNMEKRARQHADKQKNNADDFSVLILAMPLKLLALHSVASKVLSHFFECRKSMDWHPSCKVSHDHSQSFTQVSNSIHSYEHALGPSYGQGGARC